MKIPAVLLIFLSLTSCTGQGWIVGNIPITPSDSVSNTVFTEIVDVDSVTHWYHGYVHSDVNYCYKHDRLEEIKVQ